jgi:hypothetical protein
LRIEERDRTEPEFVNVYEAQESIPLQFSLVSLNVYKSGSGEEKLKGNGGKNVPDE